MAVGLMLLGQRVGHAETVPLVRKTIDLMGEWRLKPVEGKVFPAEVPMPDESWLAYQAGTLWTDHKHDSAWLVKTIDVAPEDTEKVFRLEFEGVTCHSRLFVNGQKLDEYVGGDTPFVVTLPRGLMKAGTNTIALGLTNASALLGENGKIWPPQIGSEACLLRDRIRDWPRYAMAMSVPGVEVGITHPARLVVLPPVYMEHLFVKTSTRRMRIEAEMEIVNATDAEQTVWVRGRVLDYMRVLPACERTPAPDGASITPPETYEPVLSLWPIRWTLKPGERRVVTVAGSWVDRPQLGLKGPEFWSPEHPKLYWFEAELSTAGEKDPASDRTGTRFGFREIWVEQGRLFLNGRKTFIGGGSVYGWGARPKEKIWEEAAHRKFNHYSQMLRFHVGWPTRAWLETVDELGLVTLVQPPIAAGGSVVRDPVMWDVMKRNYMAHILAYRNHPSIVIWSTDNEATFSSGMPDLWAVSVPFLIDHMTAYRRIDPTRLLTSSHAYDLRGHSDFLDVAYANHASFTRFPYDMYKLRSWYFDLNAMWDRVKPLLSDEWGEGGNREYASATFGDIVHRPPYFTRNLEYQDIRDFRALWPQTYAHAWGQYMGIMETRKQDACQILLEFGDRLGFYDFDPTSGSPHYTWHPTVRECAQKNFKLTVAFPENLERSFVAGRAARFRYLLINDSQFPFCGELRWTLRVGDETMEVLPGGPWTLKKETARTISKGVIPLTAEGGTRVPFVMEAQLPKSNEPRALNLAIALVRHGDSGSATVEYEDAQQFSMVPPATLARAPRFSLIGGEASRRALAAMNGRFSVRRVAEATDRPEPIVVGAEAELGADDWSRLEAFVRRGGNLLVLARSHLPAFFGGVDLEDTGQVLTFSHRQSDLHPITVGLSTMDGFWWPASPGTRGDDNFLVAKECLRRPTQGNFRIVAQGSIGSIDGGQGPVLAPMLEVRIGKGSAVFTSYLLQEKAAIAPSAAYILQRAVEYLARSHEPLKPAMAIGVNLSRAHAVTVSPETPLDPRTIAAVVVNGAEPIEAETAVRLAAYARAGGTVIVHDTRPETAAAVGAIFGITLESFVPELWAKVMATWKEVTVQAGENWIRWIDLHPEKDPLFMGLSNFDVNWTWSSGLGWIIEKGFVAKTTLRTSSPDVIEVGEPGGILLQRLGKGRVLYSQVRWHEPQDSQYARARGHEYLLQLLTNAGVEMAPPTSPGGSIREWLILGPFKTNNERGRESDLEVELGNEAALIGHEGQEVVRTRPDGTIERRLWTRGRLNVKAGASQNLNNFFGIADWARPTWDYYVAYAFAVIESPEEQEVVMTAAVDDTLTVYLNGAPLLRNPNAGQKPYNMDSRYGGGVEKGRHFMGNLRSPDDIVFEKALLKKGKNTVLVKAANYLGAWGFVLQVKEAQYPLTFGVE